MKCLFASVAIVGALLVVRGGFGADLYVDDTATGTNDGMSWMNAFTDLQTALDAALPNQEIWVAEGVYIPSEETISMVGRSATFSLKEDVRIFGGFDGTESTFAQRAGLFDQTVLSGDRGVPGDPTDNAWHVVTASSLTGDLEDTVFDGFRVMLGNAEDPNVIDPSAGQGGGLLIDNAALTVANVVISDNRAGSAFFGVSGAGIAVINESEVTMFQSLVESNTAESASGSFAGGILLQASTLSMTDCIVRQNEATSPSGSSQGDGGGLHITGSQLSMRRCLVKSNEAKREGAGMVIMGGANTVSVHQSRFIENTTEQGDGGGALVFLGDAPPMSVAFINCEFAQNVASGDGGAIYIDKTPVDSLVLTNCTIADNTAGGDGGGIAGEQFGGSGRATLRNCILWDNEDSTIPSGTEPSQIFPALATHYDVEYTDIEGFVPIISDFDDGTNIGGNPDFIPDTTDFTHRLGDTSDAIDAGNNFAVPMTVFQDLDLNSRRIDHITMDTGNGSAPIVDMGAYEAPDGCSCPGDANGDGDVNITDLNFVLGNFSSTVPACESGDVTGDGVVDINDLNEVLGNFNNTCGGEGAEQEAQSGGGSQHAAAVELPNDAPGENSAAPIEPDLPAYLLYLGWESEADYAHWIDGLDEQNRLIHMIELVRAYEDVGE